MGVISCRFLRMHDASIDSRNRGTYRVVYRVRADTELFSREMANGALAANVPANGPDGEPNDPLPVHGQSYDYRSLSGPLEHEPCSLADEFFVKFLDKQRRTADVTVLYRPLGPGESILHRTIANPLQRPARWHWEQESYQKVLDRDYRGRPLLNAAGRAFDVNPTAEQTRGVHVARFNVADQWAAIALVRKYNGAVNYDAWTFFGDIAPTGDPPMPDITKYQPARGVLCRWIRSGETITECPYEYVPMEIGLVYAEDGETWDEKVVNQGYGHYRVLDTETYGYAVASADWAVGQAVPVQGLVIAQKGPGASPPGLPATLPNPGAEWASGRLGDTVPVRLGGGGWELAEPQRATDDEGALIYDVATTADGKREAEPVLLARNGTRLPIGMNGYTIPFAWRREVDFNDLNALLLPTVTP